MFKFKFHANYWDGSLADKVCQWILLKLKNFCDKNFFGFAIPYRFACSCSCLPGATYVNTHVCSLRRLTRCLNQVAYRIRQSFRAADKAKFSPMSLTSKLLKLNNWLMESCFISDAQTRSYFSAEKSLGFNFPSIINDILDRFIVCLIALWQSGTACRFTNRGSVTFIELLKLDWFYTSG